MVVMRSFVVIYGPSWNFFNDLILISLHPEEIDVTHGSIPSSCVAFAIVFLMDPFARVFWPSVDGIQCHFYRCRICITDFSSESALPTFWQMSNLHYRFFDRCQNCITDLSDVICDDVICCDVICGDVICCDVICDSIVYCTMLWNSDDSFVYLLRNSNDVMLAPCCEIHDDSFVYLLRSCLWLVAVSYDFPHSTQVHPHSRTLDTCWRSPI